MTPAGTDAFAFIYVIMLTLAIGGVSSAPWVPTKRGQRGRLVSALDLREGATVYDLGCGDGAVLFDLASANPSCKAIGYEIALLPCAIGLCRKFFGGRKYANVRLSCRDFFSRPLGDADAVFVFLLEHSYPRVMRKLGRELPDAAVVAVQAWPFPGAAPFKVLGQTAELLPLYLYRGRDIRAALPAS